MDRRLEELIARPASVAELGPNVSLGEEAFQAIRQALGQNPTEAARRATAFSILRNHRPDRDWGWRFHAMSAYFAADWAIAVGRFLHAGRFGRPLMAVGAIDCFARLGKKTAAYRLGTRLWKADSTSPARLQVATAMANATTFFDDHRAGQKWAARAYEMLEESTLPAVRASVINALAAHRLYYCDADGALELSREAARQFAEAGLPYFADMARMNVAQAHLLRGELDQALSQLVALRDDGELPPADLGRCEELIGDTFLRLAMPESAEDAFLAALRLHRRTGQDQNAANVLFGIATARRNQGKPVDARIRFLRAARAFDRLDNPVSALCARAGAARCASSEVARRELRQLMARARLQTQGIAHLALTEAALEIDPSLATIAAHRRLANKVGLAALDWQSHFAQAAMATSPRRSYARMLEAIERERLLRESTESQMRLLADRQSAVEQYLQFLVDAEDWDAIREVLGRIRSVAILDELRRTTPLPPGAQALLEAMRAEWSAPSAPRSERRRGAAGPSPRRVRQWAELSRQLEAWEPMKTVSAAPAEIAFEAQGTLYRAGHRVAVRELESLLRWWHFELMAPQLDRNAAPDEALHLLCQLRKVVGPIHAERICPDGIGWSLPWSLLGERELHVDLLPDPPASREFAEENVAIWCHAVPELPLIEQEVAAVRARFPHAELFRTAKEIRAAAGTNWKWIHVACHADFLPENPMFSALHLADGPLWATEVAKLDLRAERVVLSACDTGRLGTRLRYEPEGWVRAFMARGASEVLASLWPLDDEAGTAIFSAFYRELSAYNKAREALSTARQEVRDRFPHPYFWGAPALYGRLGEV